MTALPLPDPLHAPARGRARKATQAKTDHLLRTAAALMAEKGFEATAIRDVGRKADASLAGMYYHFASKEDLLYQIQQRTFASLLDLQEQVAATPGTAEQRFRRLLAGHLRFFAEHPNEMKICTTDLESLTGDYYRAVLSIRRRYFQLLATVVAEMLGGSAKTRKESARSRRVTLYVFGMLNWVFMWHDPAKDGPAERLAAEMADLVLTGLGPRRGGR